ncbi:MAG: nitroreductase family protein [Proteobacteria bacterium]|nr:nitroreductase [Desulfocapsa sp.]MBU3943233.1 nitroreductase family protein [Pseudomonadota bacterium]MBU3983593.1 nitroreductase family protein [Pseudomonadota bacterium]MBU4027869.1 nitroreductase family protein [Pseudomonadota bacterium]MBU4043543.1 nitroreductase family protein [Pseudomonadota bacterium]
MFNFRVDEERCIQCGECALDCPAGVIIMMDGIPQFNEEGGCFRCQHCLAVCPTAAVSILGKNPDESQPLAGAFPTAGQMTALIKGRRSVRRYRDEEVAADLIDELLDIAGHAPTGVNAQNVLFTVVKERAVMNALRQEVMERLGRLKESGGLPDGFIGQYMGGAVKLWLEEGKDIIFRGAPHLLITSAPKDSHCPAQDTLIALTTFQMIAHAHGLGTVWDGLFMMALSLCPDLAARLGIPEQHLVGYAMAFGWPAVEYHRNVQRAPAQVNVVR